MTAAERVGGQWNSCVLLGLGNVDCTGSLRVGTGFFVYCRTMC